MLTNPVQSCPYEADGGGWDGSWQGWTRLRCPCYSSSLPYVTEMEMLTLSIIALSVWQEYDI